MGWVPKRLSDDEIARLSVLFLAKYAPTRMTPAPAPDEAEGVVPQYHFELASMLRGIGLAVECAQSIDYLLIHGSRYNYVFSIFNRAPFRNSEVFTSAVCEYLHISYLGARPHVRALAEDKHLTKTVARSLGIQTAPWHVYNCGASFGEPPSFRGPYFIKPRFGAASEGITEDSIQDDWAGVVRLVRACHERGLDALVEQFVPGDNVTVPVIADDDPVLLPCVQDVTPSVGGILTYRQNRLLDPGLTRAIYENDVAVPMMRAAGRTLYRYLWPVDYFRVDFRVASKDRTPCLLEINVCCNLGSHSNVAIPARHIGVGHAELVSHILAQSVRRQGVFRE